MPDVRFILQGVTFVWDEAKDVRKHGIAFRQAAEAFFDPFVRIVDASRHHQTRDKLIGCTFHNALIAVVHLEVEDEAYRIISAWPAAPDERGLYDS